MKSIKILLCFVITLIMLANTVFVSALSTGFSTEEMSKQEIDRVLQNTEISLLQIEPAKKSIECFDANNGLVAIGCSESMNKTVCIYTETGEFLYGYRFKSSGSFGIDLVDNVLNIYLVRSDVALSIDSSGTVIDVQKIQNTQENNDYWAEVLHETERVNGDKKYKIKNDMGLLNFFAFSYSQLVVINANGEENIIYDVNTTQTFYTVALIIFVVLFVCLAVFLMIKEIRKGRQGDGSVVPK